MKSGTLSVILILAVFTIIGCGGKNVKEIPANESNTRAAGMLNDNNLTKAPDFTLTSTNGRDISLSEFRGKIVVIDFWATWCPPCRKGIPDLIDLQKQYKNDLVVIGISLDTDTRKDVIPFIKQYGINYQVAYGNGSVIHKYGDIEAIPTSFVIDRDGYIVKSYVGLHSKDTFVNIINKLTNKL